MPAYRYHDLLFRIIISLVAAHFIVVFGETDSIFRLLLSWDYYRSVLLSAIIAFALISIVYLVVVKLDRRFDWSENPIHRIGLQFAFGLVLPGIIAFILATIYFRVYGINIFVTRYLLYDFPVILLFLLMVNLYYYAYYLYLSRKHADTKVNAIQEPANDVFIVSKGTQTVPLPISEISYFYHEGDYNFLRTVTNEDFLVTQTLDEVQKMLPEKLFFRINRQFIAHFHACKSFEPFEHGRLRLFLYPAFRQNIVISQKRAKAFREWLKRKAPHEHHDNAVHDKL